MPHIKHTAGGDFAGYSWCGVRLAPFDWTFQSLDYAAYAAAAQDSVLVCLACARKAAKALPWQHDSPSVVRLPLLDERKP